MRFRRFVLGVSALCWLAIAGGCGQSDPLGRRAISGTVNLDGQPLEQGAISFEPAGAGKTSSGGLITKGRYTIPKDKGLPVGKYRVVINAAAPGTEGELPPGAMPGDDVSLAQELIPPEWNTNSNHFIEVTDSGPSEFSFDVVTNN